MPIRGLQSCLCLRAPSSLAAQPTEMSWTFNTDIFHLGPICPCSAIKHNQHTQQSAQVHTRSLADSSLHCKTVSLQPVLKEGGEFCPEQVKQQWRLLHPPPPLPALINTGAAFAANADNNKIWPTQKNTTQTGFTGEKRKSLPHSEEIRRGGVYGGRLLWKAKGAKWRSFSWF